ncbi:ATP-binding cassette domain-containing protein [Xanthomonas vasicola]|uniref:ATP-binding cassette domain-containing protein n=1 Tax=Xanthomonas vasicola TaxID=56459 RepID=A0ABD7S5G3_XANVA|nr:ATP-binding cassette domain-containing protein [Xanthomonas vasicola]KGR38297.1 aliphatic sulfonates transport ATP-binding subunit [Xanthomonas vasicola]KGR38511.1 aliphatic sulfonates transport ATP-binding subunit [Xanthomonas vasicola]KGR58214.1 aliphatic sulfonates transport ATP-binding subunit [Xanthomonas vasicola]MDO6986377.1 ATP-binding cassette domain-containing protein [Xanthomonas vasicola]PPV01091.1 aliphatic sulfonate ABC transporter ATP-binding protein [Xanthomonas vasicola]
MSAATAGLPLRVRGIAKRYGDSEVLRGIDLEIAPGACVAIVGRSGCGKSTLLRVIAGLDAADTGTVDSGRAPLAVQRDAVRLMFQDARLLPWKRVIDNVALGLGRAGRAQAQQALDAVGLGTRGNEWPAALSGGQRQRVALARALVHRPRLLLLDEPLGALDALTRIEMQQLIVQLWRQRGFTLVLVTHDVTEASALADRIVVIEHGKVGLDLAVPVPHPRAPGLPALATLQAQVLSRLLGTAQLPEPSTTAKAEARRGTTREAAHGEPPLQPIA